jgi:predicted lipoprotein with Yx(FWY)xxD motif
MKKKIFFYLNIIFLASFLLISCKKDVTIVPNFPRTDIHLANSPTLGSYLVDKDENALYFFSNDVNGQVNCAGGCLTVWPPFLADDKTSFSAGLDLNEFATITNASGAKQTTYKGWPLYYYAPAGVREAPGKTTGEGVGNVWFVAKTNYSIMLANYQLTGANGINYLSNYTAGNGRTNYFCDANGKTLYTHATDSAFKNRFTNAAFTNNPVWPIYETENITVPSTLDKSLFVVITFNGRKQLTYKGWPLFYYGADAGVRGINKGITVPASQPPGAIWPVGIRDAVLAPR